MSQRTMQANLLNSEFPFNFDELGSTIVAQNLFETNRDGESNEETRGVCEAYFMQNVFPTQRGYSSVSFLRVINAIVLPKEVITDFYMLRGSAQAVAILAIAGRYYYIFDPTLGSWVEYDTGQAVPDQISVAYVKERTFFFYPGLGCFEYNFTTQAVDTVVLTGVVATSLLGICGAGSTLVGWTATQVYYSSVIDPTDFVPSLSTGAGATSALAVKGEIIVCLSLGADFIIYTATNAVSARQSGNVQFPFSFSEIPDSAGISSVAHVAYDTNKQVHITWTASGFQQVSLQQAQYIWPDLSDGIIRGILTLYNSATLRPVITRNSALDVKLNFVSNRWLAVSLRTEAEAEQDTDFSQAYIFDSLLGRWGRMDVMHRDLLEFTAPDFLSEFLYSELAATYPTYNDLVGLSYADFVEKEKTSAPKPGYNFGVLLNDGSIFRAALSETADFSETTSGIIAETPRLILGKYKLYRTQGAIMQGLKIQRMFEGATVTAMGHTYTGEVIFSKVGFSELLRQPGTYKGRINADSFSIILEGKFNLSSLVLDVSNAGKFNQRGYSDADFYSPVYFGADPVVNGVTTVVYDAGA